MCVVTKKHKQKTPYNVALYLALLNLSWIFLIDTHRFTRFFSSYAKMYHCFSTRLPNEGDLKCLRSFVTMNNDEVDSLCVCVWTNVQVYLLGNFPWSRVFSWQLCAFYIWCILLNFPQKLNLYIYVLTKSIIECLFPYINTPTNRVLSKLLKI